MKIYISLPITGHDYQAQKIEARKAEEALVRKYREVEVITPFDIVTDPDTPYHVAMGRCVEALLTCNKAYFLKGWEESKGCRTEHAIARIYGLEMEYQYVEL